MCVGQEKLVCMSNKEPILPKKAKALVLYAQRPCSIRKEGNSIS